MIDISAVRRTANSDDFGVQLTQRTRSHLVSGPVRAIKDDLHSIKIKVFWKRGDTELLVTVPGRVNTLRLAEFLRLQCNGRSCQAAFDFCFDLIG